MTSHKILNQSSADLSCVPDKSAALVVTSPPYPMIEMWDDCFCAQDASIKEDLSSKNYDIAYEKMHAVLNQVWKECDRILCDNGFICINIGDATKNCNGIFKMFSNHTKVINFFVDKGYNLLPDILWRKPTNTPNKFMGSGMLPAGAYVTYEHEYILIFRKGEKREFKTPAEKRIRRESAYFWEERNIWFSDIWEIKGTKQLLNSTNSRERSASFPFEIPYRLINMYSVKGDTVFDPFSGLGTTTLACIASERSSIAVEIDPVLHSLSEARIISNTEQLNSFINMRLERHSSFIDSLDEEKRRKCYRNENHGVLVKTMQERDIKINSISYIINQSGNYVCEYNNH